jgi:hypothetical protein
MDRTHGHERDSLESKIQEAKQAALGPHDRNPSVSDQIGEAAGGVSGVLMGAGIGSAAGPVGTLIGGIAGAIGGWWTGRAISEAVEKLTSDDDEHYRAHYEDSPNAKADESYERPEVRGAYYLGQIASHNPDYETRRFDEIEPELRRGWETCDADCGEWSRVRGYASEGFRYGVERRQLADRRAGARRAAEKTP